MSNSLDRYDAVRGIVMKTEMDFEAVAKIHNVLNFKEEASFALQAMQDNDYLFKVAAANPESLKRAVISVATIGLSLNPYKKQAYLIPRKGKICLDISYVGYLQIYQDIGAISWAMAELVREKDQFEYMGVNHEPIHKFNPFGDRGEIVGGYVKAKTPNEDYLISHMTIKEIYEIRGRSEGYRAYKQKGTQSIWNTDESEMIKKTLIRRARKSWPMVSSSPRLEKVFEVEEENNPVALNSSLEEEAPMFFETLEKIKIALEALERTEENFTAYLSRMHKRVINNLEDLTLAEMRLSLKMLNQLVDQKNQKEQK